MIYFFSIAELVYSVNSDKFLSVQKGGEMI